MAKGKVFYIKKEPDEESGNLYYKETLDSKDKLLVDVKTFGGENNKNIYTINGFYPSPDGNFVAVSSSPSGSEDDVTYIINIGTGELLPDRIEKTGFGVSWLPDSKSFFYLRLNKLGADEPQSEKYLDTKSYLHYVGTNQDKDREILSARKYSNLNMERIDVPFLAVDKQSNTVFGIFV
jgi:prolyl oligopeptidase